VYACCPYKKSLAWHFHAGDREIIRLIGLDQLNIGTVVGKMHGGEEEVKSLLATCESSKVSEDRKANRLAQNWECFKPVIAVASGGLHPGHVPKIMQILGRDIVIQFGGGIHAHPEGTRAGATAIIQAIDAIISGEKIKDYAMHHKELDLALQKWGTE